ncbi:MAG TPA: DUF2171 domain-containing protein [Allosphingosinicella sp.]|nr:DUF2171 domain-containing protein [Allosphingosinicella sp.]
MSGGHDNRSGADSFGGGWGNQVGDSWNRERPGTSAGGESRGRQGERSSSSWGNESYGGGSRNSDWGAGANSGRGWDRDRSGSSHSMGHSGAHHRSGDGNERYGDFSSAGGGGGSGPEFFGQPGQGGTSGFGGGPDHGRRFDRIDPGHVGAQGAHPMSSPVGGAYGSGFGISAGGGGGSSAARYAAAQQGQMQQGGNAQGGMMGSGTHMGGRHMHDPNYSEWRRRQIESLDRDYEEYCREHQSKFDQEFHGWREKRQGQRQSMSRVTEHMEVVGSDDQKIGTVDKVAGDRIILTKNDENAGGRHHSIPCSWIESVDDKVRVNKSRDEAMRQWQDEERSRALFEREDSGSEGPHVLNRSFSGTY